MAEIYKFFDSTEEDPRFYQASDFAYYFGKVLSTGLLHVDEVPGLLVTNTGTDLSVNVSPGGAIMQGHVYENTTTRALSIALPGAFSDRIDRVVLRLDNRYETRHIKLFVKEGVASANPVVPPLQRDNEIYELSLAQIRVRSNTSTINPTDILDERLDKQVAGLTFSLISKPHLADIAKGSYSATATVDGQKDFVIPFESFNKDGDGLTVFVNGIKAPESSYTLLHPRTVRFNVGKGFGTLVEFEVIRGIILMPDDYILTAGEVGILDAGGYFLEENVEGALQKLAGIGSSLRKEVSNLNLQLDISKRVQNAYTFGTDWLNSFGMAVDISKAIITNTVSVGTSVLNVNNSTGFAPGQKATLFNRFQSEEVTVVSVSPTSITVAAITKAYSGTVNIARSNVRADGSFGTTDIIETSFETGVEGWVYSETENSGGYDVMSGGISSEWASLGTQSYLLGANQTADMTIPVPSTSIGRIKKIVDLTEIEFITFDARLLKTGQQSSSSISTFKVGTDTKWSSQVQSATFTNVTIDVRDQTGMKEITFEAIVPVGLGVRSEKFYIDNIRFSYAMTTADIRFTTKPTDSLVMWAEHGSLLTVNAEMNGVPLTKTSSSVEDQFVGQKTYSATEVRLSLTRSSTGAQAKINKILGGVG